MAIDTSGNNTANDKIDIHSYIASLSAEANDLIAQISTPNTTFRLLDTGLSCEKNGEIKMVGDCCYECSGGTWHYANGGYAFETRNEYQRGTSGNSGDFSKIEKGDYDYNPTPIYAKDGCTIIGYEPKKYAEGKFGYWETEETYPLTEDHNCEKIYGDLAGENIRLFKVPSTAKLPHFVSFKGGVPNKYDAGNVEDNGAFVFMTGIKVDNIPIPKNLPKPLCKDNPFTILMAERTEGNKTVIGTGLAIGTFKGKMQNEDFAFPKIAVNSNEYFDREINPPLEDTFRGGTNMDKAAYVVHSPDFHFRRPYLDADYALFEQELNGKGFRYGLYAEGQKPDSPNLGTEHNKGARQSILLNHTSQVVGAKDNSFLRKCMKAMSYAPANSIVTNDKKFSYSLSNLWKESSTYVEFLGNIVKLSEESKSGYGGKGVIADLTSDNSFMGDCLEHEKIIDGRAHLVTFMRNVPRQYGSLVSMAAIPILEATTQRQTSISGLVGDSYNNAYTVKRTSYVSDKVPQDITPNWFEMPSATNFGRILGLLLRPLGKAIGAQLIGDVPLSGSNDIRNTDSLRNGIVPSGRDTYYPHVVKTNIWFWANSDVNVDYRQVGSVDNGEVHTQKLKSLMLDSAFPDGWDWRKTFLNRFYALSTEPARWKIIARILLNFIFTFLIGFWFIISGWWDVTNGLAQIGGGSWGLQTIGAVIAVAFGILKIILGYTWIRLWVSLDIDNKIIDNFLKLDLVRPDIKNPDKTFSMFDSRIYQENEDNYHKYNIDLGVINNNDGSFSMSDPYYTEKCDVYDNMIHYSDPQVTGSNIDAWRNFKVNNIYSVPEDSGQVKKLITLSDRLFAHTTDNIIALQSGRNTIQSNQGTVFLGEGTLFGSSTPLYGGIVEGFGGISDPNASVITKSGYVFPDREARKWYVFNGGANVKEIGEGVKMFLENNGDFELLRHYPNFKNVDNKSKNGIGYSVGVDNRLDRLIVTKIDYRPLGDIPDINSANLKNTSLFCDVSWTISFDINTLSAISFHSYKKLLYAWNRFDLYSFGGSQMDLHNIKGLFNCFDKDKHPFVVELVFALGENFKFEGILIDNEMYEYDGCKYYRGGIKTFNKLLAYNDRQCSLDLNLVDKNNDLDADRLKEDFVNIPYDYQLRRFAVSQIHDKVKDEGKPFFECVCNPAELKRNKNFQDDKRDNTEFRGDYLVLRLTSDNLKKNEKLLFKCISFEADYEAES